MYSLSLYWVYTVYKPSDIVLSLTVIIDNVPGILPPADINLTVINYRFLLLGVICG